MGADRSQRVAAASLSSRTWHTLSQPELDEKLQQSEERRKQWRLQMDPGKMEAEKRCVADGSAGRATCRVRGTSRSTMHRRMCAL
jgi:hypothetical protein